MVDNNKALEGELSPGSDNVKGDQGEHTSNGEAMPNRIWFRTGPLNSILPELTWKQASEQIQNLFQHVPMKDWKMCFWIHLFPDLRSTRVHTPLTRFYVTLLQEYKPDLNSKTFVFSMLFYLTLSQRMFMKLLQILIGLLQCKRSCNNLKETRFGTLYHGLRTY